MTTQARGNVIIDPEECKGCGLCVESCPPECLELAPELSKYGVHPVQYSGEDCTGCGACFYCQLEPGSDHGGTPHSVQSSGHAGRQESGGCP